MVGNQIMCLLDYYSILFGLLQIPSSLNVDDIEICAMNGTIKLAKPIPRDRMIATSEYIEDNMLLDSYYDGKKIRITYFFNEIPGSYDGRCHCKDAKTCGWKKRSGVGEGECIILTLILFKTGSIRIFGVKSFHQLNVIHTFINCFLEPCIVESNLPNNIKNNYKLL